MLFHIARQSYADRLPIQAEVLAIIQAVNAIVTGDVKLHSSHTISRFEALHQVSCGHNGTGELMPCDDWVSPEVFTIENMDICPIDITGHDLDQYLAGPGSSMARSDSSISFGL